MVGSISQIASCPGSGIGFYVMGAVHLGNFSTTKPAGVRILWRGLWIVTLSNFRLNKGKKGSGTRSTTSSPREVPYHYHYYPFHPHRRRIGFLLGSMKSLPLHTQSWKMCTVHSFLMHVAIATCIIHPLLLHLLVQLDPSPDRLFLPRPWIPKSHPYHPKSAVHVASLYL